MHFGHSKELAEAVVEFAREFAALFVLELQHADAQAAGAFLGAFAVRELVAEEAEVNPEKQDGKGEHGQDNDQRGAKQIAGKLLPLAEEFFFFVVHFLRDVHEVSGGRDVFAAQAKLSRFVQRSGPAQLDGSVQQFQTAKNIVVQLDAQSLLNGIVLGEIANLDQHLVSLGFRAAVGSKIGGVTRIH